MPIDLDSLETEPLPPDPEPSADLAPRRGFCRICGQRSQTRRGTYCADHAHLDQRKPSGKDAGKEPKKDAAPKGPKAAGPKSSLQQELTISLRTMGMFWLMTGPRIASEDMPYLLPDFPPEMAKSIVHPGEALANQSETLAKALVDAAAGSDRMTKWLEAAAQPSGVLSVAVAVIPIATSAKVWYSTVTPRYKEIVAQQEAAAMAQAAQEGEPQNNGAAAA